MKKKEHQKKFDTEKMALTSFVKTYLNLVLDMVGILFKITHIEYETILLEKMKFHL